jgi:spore coat protein U-like protein
MKRPCPHRRPRASRALLAAAAAAALLAAPGRASAKPKCSFLVASALAFGTYDPLAAAPLDSTASIRYDCPPGQAPRVTLDAGGSGTFVWRELRQGAEVLRYNLYLDAARTAVWGDGTGGSSAGPGQTSVAQGVSTAWVFARVPAAQDVAAGVYADTVRVTLEL